MRAITTALRMIGAIMLAAAAAGCVAPNPAYVAGPVYQLPGGAEATFAAATSFVSADSAAEIRRARSGAILPSLDGADATAVADAKAETNLRLASADRTVAWAQAQGVTSLDDASPLARTAALQEFAKAMKVDLAFHTKVANPPAGLGALIGAPVVIPLDTVVASARDGVALWQEKQELRLRPGARPVTAEDLNLVIIRSVADGFNAIRRS